MIKRLLLTLLIVGIFCLSAQAKTNELAPSSTWVQRTYITPVATGLPAGITGRYSVALADILAMTTASDVSVLDAGLNYTATDVEGVLAELVTKFQLKLTTDELAAINGAALPSATNVFATMNDVSAAGGGDITGVTAGTGLSGGGLSGDVTLSLPASGATAGSYTNASLTVDAQGIVTAISTGSAGTDVTLSGAYDYLTLTGQDIALGQIDLTTDVTGLLPDANIVATIARDSELPVTGVDFDAVGTDNSTDVTLVGTLNYLTLLGQQITIGAIDLTTDTTGLLSADNVTDGSTNAIPTLTQETNWDAAYGWGDHAAAGYEPGLGNPGTDGYVLSSTAAGVRSWVAQGASSSTWAGLSDTPAAITADQMVFGNAAGTDLEFRSSLSSVDIQLGSTTTANVGSMAYDATADKILVYDTADVSFSSDAVNATLYEGTLTNSAGLIAALSDETGSGLAVFSSSPALTTPDLGTPSAAVLTNATGTAAGLTAGTATNLAGGLGGSVPYQSAADTTVLLANGTAGQVLTSNGTTLAPSWTTVSGTGDMTAAVYDPAGIAEQLVGLAATQTLSNKTFVAPALGTPASGTMTNVTGLPLTTGVTGVLPAANIDTAMTTDAEAAAAYLGITADAAGVAPNSVAAADIIDMYAYDSVPVAWMKDGAVAPAALDDGTTRSPYAYRDFDSATDEDLNFIWFVPADLSGTVIQYRVYYMITNATGPGATEGVAFSLSGASMGDNEVSNATKGTAVTVTDDALSATQYDVMITGWSTDVTVTGIAAGEAAELNISRSTADAIDDYLQDVGVFMVQIRYVKNPAR